MNSETPRTPREEIEVRLTAHLLGELASDEAAWVEELLAADPELAALHARLRQAIEFLREARAIPEPLEHSSGARLSPERRQKLIDHFKTIPAPPAIQRPRRREWRSLMPLGLAAALIALLGGVVLINGFTARQETPLLASGISVMSSDHLQTEPEGEISEFRYGERQVDFDTRTTPQPGSTRVVSPTGPPASAPYRLYATVDEAAPGKRGSGVGESARRIVLPSSRSKELADQVAVSGGAGTPRRAGESTTRFNTDSGGVSTPTNAPVPRVTAAPSASTASTTPLASVALAPPPAEPAAPAQPLAISDALATATRGTEVTAAIVPTRPISGGQSSDGKSSEAAPGSGLLGDAERFFRSGRYDIASKRYEQALNIDPSDIAARQGQERMNIARDDYGLSIDNDARSSATMKLDDASSNSVRWFWRKNESAPTSPTIFNDSEKGPGATAPSVDRNGAMAGGPSAPSEGDRSEVPHYLGYSTLAPITPPQDGSDALQDASKGLAIVEDRSLGRKEGTTNFDAIANAGGVSGARNEPQLQQKFAIKSATERTQSDARIGDELLQTKEKKTGVAAERAGEQKPATEPLEVAKLEARKEIEELTKLREEDVAAEKPAAAAPEPQPEVQTRDNPFSTFSLNVSDVAFKLASASLEQGKMPEPGTVRSEEFINAFDYRDPEPGPGARLAFASERAHYPFAQNRDLLRLSLKTAAAGRQPGRALNIVLLLDNSGSMERADRVRIVREALRVLAGQLQATDKLSIVTFARTPRLWADGVAGDKAAEVTARAGEIPPQGGTNIAAGLDLAYQTAVRHYHVGSINRVVLLTDGAANLGDVNPAALKQKVEVHRRQGIALDCFGVGWEGYNDDLLETLARNGDGRYGFINTPEEAATEFVGQLAGALHVAASDVKVQIEFNPRRVIAYRQIGYAKHQLTKEQFRDNTVDAAEIGAAESGNSLYVIEVNPRGEGDLATVRVRFKIPSTADYREQEWTVPFNGNALPLEQASPGLRLAASAGAFSEWLVSSPYAAEVTPDRLLGYLNGVPSFYGADSRPKKLEWMIRQAKSISGR